MERDVDILYVIIVIGIGDDDQTTCLREYVLECQKNMWINNKP